MTTKTKKERVFKNKFSAQYYQFFGKSKKCFGNILNMMNEMMEEIRKKNWQFDTFTYFQKFLAIQETEVTIYRQTICKSHRHFSMAIVDLLM